LTDSPEKRRPAVAVKKPRRLDVPSVAPDRYVVAFRVELERHMVTAEPTRVDVEHDPAHGPSLAFGVDSVGEFRVLHSPPEFAHDGALAIHRQSGEEQRIARAGREVDRQVRAPQIAHASVDGAEGIRSLILE